MTVIAELAIVVAAAAGLGIAARLLKQPPILAYLIAGALVGYFGLLRFGNREVFQAFSDLGIMFILFLVGLEINYASLKLVGKPAVVAGVAQVVFTFIFGLLLSRALGFMPMPSFYIAIALTFSSTIIVVQLLTEGHALQSLYGKLSVGILLVQDFVAIVALVVLSGFARGESEPVRLILTPIAGIALCAVVFFLGRHFFPWLFGKIAHMRGLLFLSSIAWLFILAAVMERVGFSIEIGGFLAGLALANSFEHFEIASRMRPLRDFFIVAFFVVLGSSLFFADLSGLLLPIIVFSLFVLVGNSFIVFTILRIMGYTERTSFLSGLAVAQISEFSLIVVALGARVGHVGNDVVALVTAVGVITITVSTYFITHGETLYAVVKPYLRFLGKLKAHREPVLRDEETGAPILLIGCDRTGREILKELKPADVLVVDFNPDVVAGLRRDGHRAIFGDVSDVDLLDQIDFAAVKKIISTTPSLEDNLTLLEYTRDHAKKRRMPRAIMRAEHMREKKLLLEAGAAHVFVPEEISGEYVARRFL